jgi:hypothetical protein
VILKGSYKLDAFLHHLTAHISPGHSTHFSGIPEDGVIYLGAGYWRVRVVSDPRDGGGPVIGVRLINPDRTPEEIDTVERGLAILMRMAYVEEPSNPTNPDLEKRVREMERVGELMRIFGQSYFEWRGMIEDFQNHHGKDLTPEQADRIQAALTVIPRPTP